MKIWKYWLIDRRSSQTSYSRFEGTYIPKANGKLRPLEIPAFETSSYRGPFLDYGTESMNRGSGTVPSDFDPEGDVMVSYAS